jgi:hypothetical protein
MVVGAGLRHAAEERRDELVGMLGRTRTSDRRIWQIMEVAPNAFITVERAERPIGGSAAEQLTSRHWPWERSRIGSP